MSLQSNKFSQSNSDHLSDADRIKPWLIETYGSLDAITSEHIYSFYSAMNPYMAAINPADVSRYLPSRPPEIKTSKPIGLIVETRQHPNLVASITEVREVLNIPVHVFCSQYNSSFLHSSAISSYIADGTVYVSELGTDQIDRGTYSALMTNRDFWNHVMGRGKVLVFQTDAVLCRLSEFLLSDFYMFDYIGSGWGRERPEGIVVDGGNGGLSLRDWSRTIECIERFPPSNWRGGEDTYYCFHMDLIGKVAKNLDSHRFGSQNNFLYKSLGAHKIDKMRPLKQLLFLIYCPEGSRIVSRKRLVKEFCAKLLRNISMMSCLGFFQRYFRCCAFKQRNVKTMK